MLRALMTGDVEFFIDYEFKSRILGAVMGTMFDRAFRMFSEAFEKRADVIYGPAPAAWFCSSLFQDWASRACLPSCRLGASCRCR